MSSCLPRGWVGIPGVSAWFPSPLALPLGGRGGFMGVKRAMRAGGVPGNKVHAAAAW